MDPASAIGVASSAIAFAEFTYKFLKVLYEVYEDGQPMGLAALEEKSTKMSDMALNLSVRNKAARGPRMPQFWRLQADVGSSLKISIDDSKG